MKLTGCFVLKNTNQCSLHKVGVFENPKSRERLKHIKMSDYSTFNASYGEIKDQEVKRFVDHVTAMLQLSVNQAVQARATKKPMKFDKITVGGKQKMDYSSVAEVVDGFIAKQSLADLKGFVRHNGPKSILGQQKFGMDSLKAVNINDSKYVLNQVNHKTAFSYIDDTLLYKVGGQYGINAAEKSAASETPKSGTPQAVALKLNLKKIKCLDETDPEWPGSDSIAAGGVTVDDKKVQSIITEFSCGNFNDGTLKTFTPTKVLKSFALDSVNPSTFMAFITIAEKDNGGFSKFLGDLYAAVQAEVQVILTELGAAAGAAIGTAIGGSIGTAIAGPLGTIIGIAAGLILGALIGWLVSALRDDIFDPQITGVILNNNTPFTGPTETLTYQDFGGKYTAQVFWSAS